MKRILFRFDIQNDRRYAISLVEILRLLLPRQAREELQKSQRGIDIEGIDRDLEKARSGMILFEKQNDTRKAEWFWGQDQIGFGVLRYIALPIPLCEKQGIWHLHD